MSKRKKRTVKSNVIHESRQLLKIGRSHYISISREFIEAHGLKAGDWLPTVANHILNIIPMPEDKPKEDNDGSK